MRIVTNIEISISSHIAVTVLYNKLDQQRHRYLQLTQEHLIWLAIRSDHREIVGEVIPALWVVCRPKGIGLDIREVSGILE